MSAATQGETTGWGSALDTGGDPAPVWMEAPFDRAMQQGLGVATYHVHGGATKCGCHHVALQVPGEAEVGCRQGEMCEGGRLRPLGPPGRSHPASPILTRMLLGLARRPPGLDSRMFWGFRSRWMMPLLCRSRMAPAICCRKSRMVSSLSVRMAAKGTGFRWAQLTGHPE